MNTINGPKNKNILQPTKYLVTFPEITDAVYFCQKANLPGIQLSALEHITPNLDLFVAGTKLSYNTFDISFMVNEDLSAWTNIHNWMRDITTDMKWRSKAMGQAVLTIMSNMNNPKLRIKMANIFPLSLSDLEFDSTLSAEEHLVATASFRFDYFDIEYL